MASDDTLVLQLTATIDQLTAGMAEAVSSVQSAAESFKSSGEQMADSMREVEKNTATTAAAITENWNKVTEAIRHAAETLGLWEGYRFGKETISSGMEAAHEIEHMSEMTGIGIQQMQELGYAAKAVGSDLSTVAMTVRQLNRGIYELQQAAPGQGGARARAFEGLGIDPSQLTSAFDALNKISEAFEKYGDNARTVQEATVALGGRGAALIPLIRNWQELREEFEKSGLALKDNVIEAASAAQEEWNKLGAAWEQAKIALASGLSQELKVLAQLLQELVVWVVKLEQEGKIQEWASQAADAFFSLARSVVTAVAWIADAIDKLDIKFKEVKDLIPSKEELTGVAGGAVIGGPVGALVGGVGGSLVHGFRHRNDDDPELAKLKAFDREQSEAKTASQSVADVWRDQILQHLDSAQTKIHSAAADAEELAKKHKVGGPGTTGTEGPAVGPSPQQIAAAKKAKETAFQDFVSEQHLEIAEAALAASQQMGSASALAQAKIQHLGEVYNKAVELFGAESKQARSALVEELTAEREYADQKKALKDKAIADESKTADLGFAHTKALLAQDLAEHKTSQTQEAQALLELNLKKNASDIDYLEKRRNLYAADAKQYETYTEQILQASAKMADEQIADNTRVYENSLKEQEEAANNLKGELEPISSAFEGVFESLIRGTSSVKEAFGRMVGDMLIMAMKAGIEDALFGGKAGTFGGNLFGQGIFGAFAPAPGATQETENTQGPIASFGEEIRGLFGGAAAPGGPTAGSPLEVAATTYQTATTSFAGSVSQFREAVGTTTVSGGSSFTDAAAGIGDSGLPDALNAATDASGASGGFLTPGASSGLDASDVQGALDDTSLMNGLDLSGMDNTLATSGASGPGIGSIGAAAGLLTNAIGGATGGKSPSGIQGALGGAMSGAELGMMFGPWGALIGGAAGGLAGLFGFERGGIISAANGALVNGATPAILHPKEMVLPADISEGLQNIIANGNGGDTHFHAHMNVNATDAASFRGRLREHANDLTQIMSQQMRLGNPHLSRAGAR